MDPIGIFLLSGFGIAVIACPRRWVPAIILTACCYVTAGQSFSIAGARFPAFRFLLILAIFRAIPEILAVAQARQKPTTDYAVLFLAAWLFFASFFHVTREGAGTIYTIGGIINVIGAYVVFRFYIKSYEELVAFLSMIPLIIAPVAVAMICEHVFNRNLFSVLGGVPEMPYVRAGRIRAQGAFSHPILAGTIGAFCFALCASLWKVNKSRAIMGVLSSGLIVMASASSGPLMSLFFIIIGISLFKYKFLLKPILVCSVLFYLVLMITMDRPAYYIIASINLTGSSTGWHRAFLIEQTIAHFDEWWLFGTDFTRHWMPSQGAISEYHTDITNAYIATGVMGGIAAMALQFTAIAVSFKYLRELLIKVAGSDARSSVFWCIGAGFFGNVMSGLSVAFFGQSLVFFWLPIAVIAGAKCYAETNGISSPTTFD